MNATPTDTAAPANRSAHRAAVAAAVVAGVFTVAVAVVLVVNYLRQPRPPALDQIGQSNASPQVSPLDSPELAALREALARNPSDEGIKERIRALDLDLREGYFRHLDLANAAGYLLLAGFAAFLLAVKWARSLNANPPDPPTAVDPPDHHARIARRSFAAVVLSAAVLGAVGIAAGVRESPALLQAHAAASTRPASGPGSRPAPPSDADMLRNWPQFRGPGGLGRAAFNKLPTAWDGKTGQGVLWKTAVPIASPNSPVIWGDRVFVSGASKDKRQVYCFDAGTGKLLWTGDATMPGGAQHVDISEQTTYAAPTMATDGQGAFAIFANGDVTCFDMAGKPVWSRNLGPPDNHYGHASSLAIHQGRLLVLYDQGDEQAGKSALLALDTATGKTLWEKKRPVAATWTSPILIDAAGRKQLIVAGAPWLASYDPASGDEFWKAKLLGGEMASSPAFGGDTVIASVPYSRILAVRADGQGDLTAAGPAWMIEQNVPEIVSPAADDKRLYVLGEDGYLVAYGLADGKKVWEHELKESFNASPILAGDLIYCLSSEGVMHIGRRVGEKYEPIGQPAIGEPARATPAFAPGRIYIRGETHLFCIGQR